jgi:hypothetical protein
MRSLAIATRAVIVGGALLGAASVASTASAQPLTLGVPPTSNRPTPVIPPANQGAPQLPAPETRAFVGPLTKSTKTGRVGIAAWGAPGTAASQRGPGDPDSVGWVGAGVAAEWGGGPRRTSPN